MVALLSIANLLVVSPPGGLDFAGAGFRRPTWKADRAADERRQDQETARRLEASGVDPWESADEVTAVDLASEGQRCEARGRPLRRLPVFIVAVRREQQEARDLIGAYVAAERAAGRSVRIVHLRVRPTAPVLLETLREHHREQCAALGRRLEYVARRSDGALVPLVYGTHHRPLDGGARIDWHAHVAVQVREGADLAWLSEYLGGADRVWIDQRGDRADAPEALASYLRQGAARYVDAFTDERLAQYVVQVAGLHRYQTLGPLRRLAGALRRERLRPRMEGARIVLAPPPRRPARRLCWTAGPSVVALRLAWVGQELRPVVLVRCWRGDWRELAERYDLGPAVAAARAALTKEASTETTSNPDSLEAAPVASSPPSSSPPSINQPPVCSEPAPVLPSGSAASGTAATGLRAGAAEPHAARLAPSQPLHARPLNGAGSSQTHQAQADTWPTAVQVSVLDRPDLVPRLWAALDRLAEQKARAAGRAARW